MRTRRVLRTMAAPIFSIRTRIVAALTRSCSVPASTVLHNRFHCASHSAVRSRLVEELAMLGTPPT